MNTKDIVNKALAEDIPSGDITTDPLQCSHWGKAICLAKAPLTVSGCEPFEMTFKSLTPDIQLKWEASDGDTVSEGQTLCVLSGPLNQLLQGERTALNFLGHLSGIATITHQFVEEVKGTKTKITDTRKTTPLLRDLEKEAVRHGGGVNHRKNLSDGILIKENHIQAAGSITQAVTLIKEAHPNKEIEVEVTNLEEINESLSLGVERLLLDNMNLNRTKEAVEVISGRCLVEASGNMTLDRVRSLALLGIDYISVGRITHSAPTADISLIFQREDQKHEQ